MRANWRECALGDVARIKHGYAFKGEFFGSTGTHVVLTPGNFHEAGGFKEKADKAKWYSGPVPDEYVLNAGDVVVAMTEQSEGLLGSSALVPRSGFYLHNQRLGLVTPASLAAVDRRFLYYLFNSCSVRQQIRASANGAKIRHTSPTRIYEVKVRVPDVATQRRIASILSAYDDLIENNTRRIAILEEMARRIYEEWFVRFRFPGHEVGRLVESELGLVPEGWRYATLNDLCESIEDGDWIETKDQGGDDYRLLQISNVGVNRFVETGNLRFVSQDTFKRLRCREILPRQLLIARMPTPIGRAWLVTPKPWKMVTAVDVAIATADASKTSPEYLLHFFNSDVTLAAFATQASGTTRLRITRRQIAAMPLLAPPPSLAHKFAELVRPMNELAAVHSRRNDVLRTTRDLLLPKLISGELDLSALPSPEELTTA